MEKIQRKEFERILNKIIYVLHIHKSGGTTICSLLSKEGLRVSDGKNCNVQSDQSCCGGNLLKDQVNFAAKTSLQVVANERYMIDEMDKEHYVYVVTIRKSLTRYMSHYNHVSQVLRTAPSTFLEWLDGQPDNWNVRHLCGIKCQLVPKFGLTPLHFEMALKKLSAFDHIITTENMTGDYNKMAKELHFKQLNSLDKKNKRNWQASKFLLNVPPHIIYLMTALDDKLYNTSLDTTKYFAETELQSACGNKCTPY